MLGEKIPKGWISKEDAVNGVYILTMNDFLVTKEEWMIKDNDKAAGVAILSDNCKFVISPSEELDSFWGESDFIIKDIVTTGDKVIAAQDYAGTSNTDKIITQLGSVNASAANYCRNFTFKHGKKGYLGAFGEWMEAYNHKVEIDACILLIGGAAIGVSSYIWSSTQYGDSHSWSIAWAIGRVDYFKKNYEFHTRPFSAL